MAREEPEQPPAIPDEASADVSCPRLGLIHLLAWTACVALCLGLQRVVGQLFWNPARPFGDSVLKIASTVLTSLGNGAALGGLLLWVARRRRGLPFPEHPGEYLLVVLGLGEVVRWSYSLLLLPVTPATLTRNMALLYGREVLAVVVLLWPLLAVRSRRWRVFFGAMLASRALMLLYWVLSLSWLSLRAPATFSGLLLSCLVLLVAADAILVVIVLRERWGGVRYPWTHWAGVAVALWLALIGIRPMVSASIVLLRSML